MTKDTEVEDFDFANANESPKEETVMTKLKGTLTKKTKEIKSLKNQIATSGSLTTKMIKEARELAGSKAGLDIDKFMQKNKLINIDIEQLLHAPLKKDGSFV